MIQHIPRHPSGLDYDAVKLLRLMRLCHPRKGQWFREDVAVKHLAISETRALEMVKQLDIFRYINRFTAQYGTYRKSGTQLIEIQEKAKEII